MDKDITTEELNLVKAVMPKAQYEFTLQLTHGEEGEYFKQKLKDFAELVKNAPGLYETDGAGQHPIILRYFHPTGTTSLVCKIGKDGQAYGFQCLNGDWDMAEWGGINLNETKNIPLMELDYHIPEGMTIERWLYQEQPDMFPQYAKFNAEFAADKVFNSVMNKAFDSNKIEHDAYDYAKSRFLDGSISDLKFGEVQNDFYKNTAASELNEILKESPDQEVARLAALRYFNAWADDGLWKENNNLYNLYGILGMSYQPKPAELNNFIKNTYNELHGIVEETKSLNENDTKDIKQNFVLEKLADAGIKVVTDKDEFDRILEEEDILQKMSDFNKDTKLTIEIRNLIADSLQKTAEEFIPTVYSRENYLKIFKDGIIETPFETVKIGPNQFVKLCPANRNNLMLAIRRTLETPSLILEKETFDENTESFKPVHVYGKSFINTSSNHTKTVESIIVFKEGKNIAMSLHNKDISKFVKQIKTADDIIYLDKEASRVVTIGINAGDNRVVKEIQEFLSSSEQKFLPFNPQYDKTKILSSKDFIKQNNVDIGNLEITKSNFDSYFNIFNRHIAYKDNPDKIASELFNYHVSDINKETMRIWLKEEGYTIKEKNNSQKMILNDGVIYGFAYENKIYLNPDIMNSEVAIHEYTHLWDNYTRRTNPELWQKGKNIFKNTKFWSDIKADPNYADIADNDDLLLSEVHAQICGKMADAILTKIAERDGELTKDTVIDWDNEVWDYMQKELGFSSSITQSVFNTQDVKEFLSTPMKDLMYGIQITKKQQQNEIIENTSPAQKPEKNIYEQTIETFSQAMNKMIETLKIQPTDENIGRVSNTVLNNSPELKEPLLSIMHQNGCTNAEKTMAFLHTVHQGDFDKLDLHDKKRVINNHTNSYDKDEFSISD